jgi:hypothetical protein
VASHMGVAAWFVPSDHGFKSSRRSNVTVLTGTTRNKRLNLIGDGGKRDRERIGAFGRLLRSAAFDRRVREQVPIRRRSAVPNTGGRDHPPAASLPVAPETAATCTFSAATFSGRSAVSGLGSQIVTMRTARPGVSPVVELHSAPYKRGSARR